MENDQEQKGHVTIRRGLSFPPLVKCMTCCFPGLYHCPFCSPASFRPSKRSKVLLHLEIHLRKAYFVEGYTIHKCALECMTRSHYHCLYCLIPMPIKPDLHKHLQVCEERKNDPKLYNPQDDVSQGVETGEATCDRSLDSSFITESDDNDESEEIIVSDSLDRNIQEGSSSMSSTSFMSSSRKRDATGSVKRRKCPVSKCDKMIQTNIERPQDCDEFYFLNLAKLFKNLTPHKKTNVRMKIEQILFEAEFT